MPSTKKTIKFPLEVFFLEGLVIRRAMAIGAVNGVWTLRTDGNFKFELWEEDVFTAYLDALRAVNAVLN